MRILAVTYCRAMFGANRALVSMIKDLRDRYGIETEVLMPSVYDGNLAEILTDEGVVHYAMPMKMWVCPVNSRFKRLRSISAQLKTSFLSEHIRKLLDKNRYDLIYTNNSTVQYGAILAKKWKIPHVWHVREFGSSDYGFDYSYPVNKRVKFFQSANTVIAISNAMLKYAEKELCPGAKVCRIYDGVYLSKKPRYYDKVIENNKSIVPDNQSCVKIACVATLQPGKNQMELLEAVKILVDRSKGIPSEGLISCDDEIDSSCGDFRVFIIGEGPDETRLRLYVKKNNLDQFVVFCGYREDVRQVLDTMDIGVVCSRSEGFGLVTCEYMESSMPVVGADSGATPELIDDGYNGYLYPLGKVDILADKLKELIIDKNKRIRMGMNAYERVYMNFSIKKNTDEMYNIFSNALTEGNASK